MSIASVNKLSESKRELLAKLLEAEGLRTDQSIPPRGALESPLSFAQQRMWFLEQMEPGSAVFNLTFGARLKGELDEAAVRASMAEIVRRHDVMRTTFELRDDNPVQVVHPGLTIDVPTIDISHLPAEEREAEMLRRINEEHQKPFSLAHAPLIRTQLLRLAPDEHVLMGTLHHIISDGWSLTILLREFVACYVAFREGKSSPLPELSIQYGDFAAWQREFLSGDELKRQVEYWKQQLSGAPSGLDLPTDFPRPPIQSTKGNRDLLTLPTSLSNRVREVAAELGVTPFMVLMGTFHLLLARYSGQKDICVGSPVAGRKRVETEPLIGVFVNPLVFRCDLSGNPTVREFLGRVRNVTLDGFAHQDLPFEKLVEELHPARDLSRSPLFQAMFILLNLPPQKAEFPGLTVGDVAADKLVSEYDLTLTLRENDGRLSGWLEYNSDLFQPATIRRMTDHYQALLTGLCANPDGRIFALPMLSDAERRNLIQGFNDTEVLEQRLSVYQSFEAQSARIPDRVAVTCDDNQITYETLNTRANQVARRLRDSGVGADALVGICMNRSVEMVVAMLAVLKAGGAYVPLDPSYPPQRVEFMLTDSGARVLITHENLLDQLPRTDAEVICIDRDWPTIATYQDTNLDCTSTPDDLAYVIYTSGSTGKPKGVMIPHRALSNFLDSMGREPGISETDTLLAITTLSFDIAGLEIYLPLVNGARLEIVAGDIRIDGRGLARKIETSGATIMQATPATWRLLIESEWQGNKNLKVLIGGEAVPRDLSNALLSRVGELWNVYGPTETTIWSTTGQIICDEPVSIGKPIANTQVYILDEQLQPVPPGVVGEIFIAGTGLARGYLHRPELTNERFINDPFNDVPGARMYRTGDLGRHLPDGRIECLGRVDHQVKVRGYRIELGEIEACLADYDGVKQNVVVVRDDAFGEKRLVAYVVGDKVRVQVEAVRGFLKQRLPEFMVPSTFIFLDALPLTPNGKIDRNALPAGDLAKPSLSSSYVAPRSELERTIADVWATVLKLDRVGVNDNFFEIGGHSLLLTRVHSELVRRGDFAKLSIIDLFRFPTVQALATHLEPKMEKSSSVSAAQQRAQQRRRVPIRPERAARQVQDRTLRPHQDLEATQSPAASAPQADKRKLLAQLLEEQGVEQTVIPRRAGTGPVPLSRMQQRLWFLAQLEPGNAAYKVQGALPVRGNLDVDVLRKSVALLVARHESLRTVFVQVDGNPMQFVLPTMDVDVPLHDLTVLSDEERKAEDDRLRQDYLMQGFDLATGPLLRLGLICEASDKHILVISLHHIISDGWSLRIFVREMIALYEAEIKHRDPNLPELSIQYADYSEWQREALQGEQLQSQLRYWRHQLGGQLSVLELPNDIARPDNLSGRGVVEDIVLPALLVEKLNSLSKQQRASLFMTMLAAFKLLMSRLSGLEDICTGIPNAGRNSLDVEKIIGFFVNTLVLRCSLTGAPSFNELLQRVREATLGAQANQDIPFEMLVEELQPDRNLGRTPLFQVFFNMVNLPPVVPHEEKTDLSFDEFVALEMQAKFDLTLYVTEDNAGTRLSMLYPFELFRRERVREMLDQYCRLLEQIVENPEAPLNSYSLLTAGADNVLPDPRQSLNSGSEPIFQKRLSQVARKAGSSLAVKDNSESWSYEQLEEWSNKLANHLNQNGIKSGSVVAVYANRSAGLVWALLGIVKSGAAFTILDSSLPAVYLGQLILESAPQAFIQLEGAGELPAEVAAALRDTGCRFKLSLPPRAGAKKQKLFGKVSDALPPHEFSLDDTAYLVFTSATTGHPKCIVGTFRPLSHFLEWHTRQFSLNRDDHFSMLSGLGHDPLLRDIFTPLWIGASLHIVDSDDRNSYSRLFAWTNAQRISVMHLTPPMLEILADGAVAAGKDIASLRYVFFGGDSLQRTHIERLHRFAPNARVINYYGATETPQGIAFHVVDEAAPGSSVVPLGRGIDGVQLLVLNDSQQLCGIGERGEIYVRSPYLAKGYKSDEMTRESFVPNPFTRDPLDRLYRTGDLGRYLPNGEVEFQGRSDRQVKIRGNRIEPEHIAYVLRHHPQVLRCAVVPRISDHDGEPRLVAYLVLKNKDNFDPAEATSFLRARLALYQIPSAFVPVEDIPLTANGKVDVAALPEYRNGDQPSREYVPPRDDIERRLADVWQRVLRVERIGRNDDFFALGGHSLLANRMFNEVEKEFGKTLPVATLFQAPTVAQMSDIMRNDGFDAHYSSLVPIKQRGTAHPFVCVHSLGANLVSYAALANRLGEDQPFYGLQPIGLDGKEAPHTRIEEMAAHYLKELRTLQPHGPYHLGGVCLGGVVAFEMAQRLVKSGERVDSLILMDAFCPGQPKYLPEHPLPFGLVQHIDWYLGELLMRPWRENVPYVATRIRNIFVRAYRLSKAIITQDISKLHDDEGTTATIMQQVKTANSQAWNHYVPQPYRGKITLLWCSETPTRCYRDRRLAWSEVAEGGLEVHVIPGNHLTMVEPPQVDVMAETLLRCLRAAQSGEQSHHRTAAFA